MIHSASGVGAAAVRAWSRGRRSARRTTPAHRRRSSAAGRTPSVLARSPSPTAACFSSTRWASSKQDVLDGLREALETGRIMVGRVEHDRVPIPARFQLIGATNPCPCGGGGSPGDCECDERSRKRYIGGFSGPLLDRFDLRVAVVAAGIDELFGGEPGEIDRRGRAAGANGPARSPSTAAACSTPPSTRTGSTSSHRSRRPPATLLFGEVERGDLTARGLHRIRRVSRTLADLDGHAGAIDEEYVITALGDAGRIGRSAVGRAA